MASNDALISKTVDDAKNAKSNDAAASKIIDDIYDIKSRDQGQPSRLKSDYKALSMVLHEQGFLPGLEISDSTSSGVAATSADGKVRALDTDGFGKTFYGAPKADRRDYFDRTADDGSNTGKSPNTDYEKIQPKDKDTPESPHGAGDSSEPITVDKFGRLTEIRNADGSTTTVEYEGINRSPNKITTTNKDGSTVTYEKTGNTWTETTQPVDGAPVVNENVDYVDVSSSGDITTKDGSVTQVSHVNGTVDVTSQHGDDGPKTTAHYQYNADGELSSVTRTNPDGTTDRFGRNKLSGEWGMTTYGPDGRPLESTPAANVTVNSDGGISYDTGNVHVVVEGYGATHVTETTSYGTYEQSFDPSGKLTTEVRRDNTTGQTELISYINGSTGTLLVFPTSSPDSYTTPDVHINPDGSFSYVNDQGIAIDRGVDFTNDGLKQTPIDPEISAVAKENGVNVTRTFVDGKAQYEYSIETNGEHVTLLVSDGPAELDEKKLQQMHEEKLNQVQDDYGVRFGRDGETTDVDGQSVPLITPNLGQIYGVEASLARSQPDVVTKDGTPLEIDFTAVQGSNPNKGGFADGHRVVIEPNGGDDTPDQVMRVFMHELAHNGQHRLYGDDETFETTYAAKFGFVKVGDDWLLQTKDGRYFKSVAGQGGVGSSGWVRTDKDGNTVDENGNLSDHPQTISNDEARNLALVKPASGYFPNPAEAGAEATSMFRGGEESRAAFLSGNPDTYAVIKQLDQLDINKTYGLDANGQPKYIRSADGLIVANTAENQAAVKQFEDSVTSGNLGGHGGIIGGLGNPGQKIDPKGSAIVGLKPGVEYLPALADVG
ncbi:MAG: hypothetical protein HYX67_13135 [Candidatus Melainabacteria bacterium]|nr:hypothetical protein [Candidatus Melainabacteria bacterium]